ncbi:MAG: imidazoleglycerol-phosphate dehydratase HisB [Acidimicrobiales bacterium]
MTAGEAGAAGERGPRRAERRRATKETSIEVAVAIDGAGTASVETGLPFFDHMLDQLGRHGGFDLRVRARGDLHVDAHHTVEDVGIVLGECFAEALGDKAGVRRFGSALVPLDEALLEVAVDLSGRPYLAFDVPFAPDTPGLGSPPFDPQLAEEFWRAFVTAARVTLHVRRREGKNTHHVVEATFKAIARALRDAVRREGSAIPSTKGTL